MGLVTLCWLNEKLLERCNIIPSETWALEVSDDKLHAPLLSTGHGVLINLTTELFSNRPRGGDISGLCCVWSASNFICGLYDELWFLEMFLSSCFVFPVETPSWHSHLFLMQCTVGQNHREHLFMLNIYVIDQLSFGKVENNPDIYYSSKSKYVGNDLLGRVLCSPGAFLFWCWITQFKYNLTLWIASENVSMMLCIILSNAVLFILYKSVCVCMCMCVSVRGALLTHTLLMISRPEHEWIQTALTSSHLRHIQTSCVASFYGERGGFTA